MNRDELADRVNDFVANVQLPVDKYGVILASGMADALLPLIERECRTAQVEVLREVAGDVATWAEACPGGVERSTFDSVADSLLAMSAEIEREGAVDRKTTGTEPLASLRYALPLLTEEEVGDEWGHHAGVSWVSCSWRMQEQIVSTVNACIAKANEKVGAQTFGKPGATSATEPSAEPIRLLIEAEPLTPADGFAFTYAASSPDVPGWTAMSNSLTELVQLIKEGVPFALGVEGPVPFTLMDSYGEFGGDAGPDSKSSITDHSEPSAEPQIQGRWITKPVCIDDPLPEPDFTDGTWLFRYGWTDSHGPRWSGWHESAEEMDEEETVEAIKTVGSPFRVKVTTETKIEKVDE